MTAAKDTYETSVTSTRLQATTNVRNSCSLLRLVRRHKIFIFGGGGDILSVTAQTATVLPSTVFLRALDTTTKPIFSNGVIDSFEIKRSQNVCLACLFLVQQSLKIQKPPYHFFTFLNRKPSFNQIS